MQQRQPTNICTTAKPCNSASENGGDAYLTRARLAAMSAGARFNPLAARTEGGPRLSLSAADAPALFEPDLCVGRLANRVRRKKVGDDVCFVVNRHINYTNVCQENHRLLRVLARRGYGRGLYAHGGGGSR